MQAARSTPAANIITLLEMATSGGLPLSELEEGIESIVGGLAKDTVDTDPVYAWLAEHGADDQLKGMRKMEYRAEIRRDLVDGNLESMLLHSLLKKGAAHGN